VFTDVSEQRTASILGIEKQIFSALRMVTERFSETPENI
jgi:hypothetical protein